MNNVPVKTAPIAPLVISGISKVLTAGVYVFGFLAAVFLVLLFSDSRRSRYYW